MPRAVCNSAGRQACGVWLLGRQGPNMALAGMGVQVGNTHMTHPTCLNAMAVYAKLYPSAWCCDELHSMDA